VTGGRTLGAIGEGLAELTLEPGGDRARLGFGGDAANVCVMAARLGTPARLGGRVGDDAIGRRLLRFWRDQGVDVAGVRADAGASTGLYLNEETPDSGHAFTYWRNASAGSRLEPGDLPASFFAGLGVLVVTGVTLAVSRSSARAAQDAARRARVRGVRVACVLNHRPALHGSVEELAAFARSSDIVIGSRDELRLVHGDGPATVAELVRTDGPRPATVTTGDGTASQPVPDATARNAAGAGDALAGAYLAGRLQGCAPVEALRWGVAAATLSVQRAGCAASYPTASETFASIRELPELAAA
jgi:2-dehydro-3-deoxygluconokinase